MDSWSYWGPSIPPPPFLHFSFPSFSLLHCRHSGEINAEETHCFHPPAATSAIPRKKRNQNPPSAWIWLFSSLPNKEICGCATKKKSPLVLKKVPNTWIFIRRFDGGCCVSVCAFFLTARAVIWCFLLPPPGGSTHFQMGADAYLLRQKEELMRNWTLNQLMCGLCDWCWRRSWGKLSTNQKTVDVFTISTMSISSRGSTWGGGR